MKSLDMKAGSMETDMPSSSTATQQELVEAERNEECYQWGIIKNMYNMYINLPLCECLFNVLMNSGTQITGFTNREDGYNCDKERSTIFSPIATAVEHGEAVRFVQSEHAIMREV